MKFLRLLKHNSRQLCTFFLWTNFLVFFYLMIHIGKEDSIPVSSLEKEGVSKLIKDETSDVVSSEKYKFKNFPLDKWNETQKFRLQDSYKSYFKEVGHNNTCYILGTNFNASSSKCVCKGKYFGPHCGIPESAWESHYKHYKSSLQKLKPRKTPRRLIHGLQVNHEFDLFDARLKSLQDTVDVYIVLESNFSSYGEAKPLSFLNKFKSGWLSEFQDNLVYVFLPFFPKAGETNGWYADSFLRLYLGKSGMKLIDNIRDDDIFLLLDADELPTVESLMFLKLFDGWTEPVKFGFRWTVFGFYWLKAEDPGMLEKVPWLGSMLSSQKSERLLTLYVACTVGMLKQVYGNNAMLLRRNVWAHSLLKDRLANFTQSHNKPKEWTLGNSPHYAGFHCSWCYSPEGIRTKMASAQRHDKPRWGDFPEKMDLEYIESLVSNGGWFDGKHPFIKVNRRDMQDDVYAPKYFLENEDMFEYLLVPPGDRV